MRVPALLRRACLSSPSHPFHPLSSLSLYSLSSPPSHIRRYCSTINNNKDINSPSPPSSSPLSSISSSSPAAPESTQQQLYAEQNYEHTQKFNNNNQSSPPSPSSAPSVPSPSSSSSPSSFASPSSSPIEEKENKENKENKEEKRKEIREIKEENEYIFQPLPSPQTILPGQEGVIIPRIYAKFNNEIHKILQNEGIEVALNAMIATKMKDLKRVPLLNSHEIFSNSEVRFSEIDVFGFDYDYTLAQYTNQIQNEIYQMALNVLVHELKYPAPLANCTYDPNFAIRGLHYDMEKGYLMKLDFLLNIQLGAIYFGRRLVSKEEAIETYGSLQLRESYANTNLRIMSDIFCLPETCLISDVIHFLTKTNSTFEPHIIYEDVTRAVNMIHKNGSLHRTIVNDIQKYLDTNPTLGFFLAKLKNAKKKIFMLTNSPYNFADVGMQYMLGNALPPGMNHWTDLFDVVITQCDKPNFFGRGRSFRIQDQETGKNYWHKINHFQPGVVYVGGNLSWKGNRVLYFGDHLFSDLMEPSIREGWRTGVIIRELEREVDIQNSPEYRTGLSELLTTEELIYKTQYYQGPDRENVLKRLKNRRFDLRLALKEPFNKHFGSVFRTHNNPTMFAHGLQQYADLYTCKVENFASCPLDFSFYPARNFLPHEFKLN